MVKRYTATGNRVITSLLMSKVGYMTLEVDIFTFSHAREIDVITCEKV